jgi:hypothetical protein
MGRKSKDGSSSYTYFKELFEKSPELLKGRSNKDILARYRTDHGLGENAAIEQKVTNNLSNVKSNMRKAGRKRKKMDAKAAGIKIARPTNKLEALEIHIDNCLTMARNLESAGLEDVVHHLRTARNKVVWKLGE